MHKMCNELLDSLLRSYIFARDIKEPKGCSKLDCTSILVVMMFVGIPRCWLSLSVFEVKLLLAGGKVASGDEELLATYVSE